MLRFAKLRSSNSIQASTGINTVPRKRRRSVLRVIIWAALLGASIGLLSAVWKVAPMISWMIRQNICSGPEKAVDREVNSPTTNAIEPTIESKANVAGPTDSSRIVIDDVELQAKVDFINWMQSKRLEPSVKAVVVATFGGSVESFKREIIPWMQYHLALGLYRIYAFFDSDDLTVVNALKSLKMVHLIEMKATEYLDRYHSFQAGSYLENRPGNYVLMKKQKLNENIGIKLAIEESMDWIFHFDVDELFLPGGPGELSIPAVLSRAASNIQTLLFMNHEALPESEEVQNRFQEVTLFKPAKRFTPEADKRHYVFPSPLPGINLYANGKSASRVNSQTKSSGPHEFAGQQFKSNDSAILHYPYCRLDDVTKKPQRTCPHLIPAGIRNDLEALEECFVLPFDKEIFAVASRENDTEIRELYRERIMKYKTLYGGLDKPVQGVVDSLVKTGGLKRILLPQILLREQDLLFSAFQELRAG